MRKYKSKSERRTEYVGTFVDSEMKKELIGIVRKRQTTISEVLRELIEEATGAAARDEQVRQLRELDTSAESVSKARGQFGL